MLWRNGRSRQGSPWYEAVTGLDSLQDNESVGRDHGVQQAVAAGNGGRTEIPDVVTPIPRQIAIVPFLPVAIGQARVAHIVAVEVSVVVKARQNQEIVALAPASPGQHSISIMDVEDIDRRAAQPGVVKAKPDQVAVEGEQQTSAGSPQPFEVLSETQDVVVKEIVLKPHLLAEQEHGDPGRKDGAAEGEPAAGLREPPGIADKRSAVGRHDDRPLGEVSVAGLVMRLVVD